MRPCLRREYHLVLLLVAGSLMLAGCGGGNSSSDGDAYSDGGKAVSEAGASGDGGGPDAGDAGEAGSMDGGSPEAGPMDGGPMDGGPMDGATPDGGSPDGASDGGAMNGEPDGGPDATPDGGADAGAAGPGLEWTKHVPGSNRAKTVAADSDGNVYVGLRFKGDVTLGEGATLSSEGANDVAVAKYDPTGALLWHVHLGGPAVDTIQSVAVDEPRSRVCAVGWFEGTLQADPGSGNPVLEASGTSAGAEDMYVACLSLDGSSPYYDEFGNDSNLDAAFDLAFDSDGTLFVTGHIKGDLALSTTVDCGDGDGASDIFIGSFSVSGGTIEPQVCQRYGDGETQSGRSIVTDGDDNLYVAGHSAGDIAAGAMLAHINEGANDIFVAKYNGGDPSDAAWVQTIAGAGNEERPQLAYGSGRLWVGGSFASDTVSVGDSMSLDSAGAGDLFLVGYDGSGSVQYAARFGTDSSSQFGRIAGIALDGAGNPVIAGQYYGPVDLGGGALPDSGTADGFVAGLAASDGSHRFSRGLWGDGTDIAHDVAVGPDDEVFVGGRFTNDLNVGSMVLSATNVDFFLLEYAP